MPTVPRTRRALLALLKRRGPLSAAEMVLALPRLTRLQVNGALIGSRKAYGTKHFRIVEWRRQVGHGGREIPVYGRGPGPDEPRPVLGAVARKETQLRHFEENRDHINARRRAARRPPTTGPFAGLGQRAER